MTEEKEYLVTWEIALTAPSAQAAAEEAFRVQRDPSSLATAFVVYDDLGGKTTWDLEAE